MSMAPNKWKRVAAATLGVIAMFVCLIAFAYAVAASEDFRNPGLAFSSTLLGVCIMFAMGLAALGMGLRFPRFAWVGRSNKGSGWWTPLLLGIGFFFPGFVFSLPPTVLWANHHWPGDGQSGFGGIETSFYIGIASAVICCIVLLKKHRVR